MSNPFLRFNAKSLYWRATLVSGAGLILLCLTLGSLDIRAERALTQAHLRDQIESFNPMLGYLAAQSISVDEPELARKLMEDTLDSSGGVVTSAHVTRLDGTPFLSVGVAIDPAVLTPLLDQARTSNAPAISADGRSGAVPVHLETKDGDGPTLGYLATVWTPEPLIAAHAHDTAVNAGLTFVGFLVVLALSAFGMHRRIARPVAQLTTLTARLQAGDFSTRFGGTHRRDEIGDLARALENLRDSLARSAEYAREAAFKASAVEGTSASLMLADRDFNILYTNPAAREILDHHADAIKARVPHYDPKKVVGSNMDIFHDGIERARARLSDPKNLPFLTGLRFGRTNLTIEVSAVYNQKGEHDGFVVEWKDVTAEQRNAAIITAIDHDQLRVEFSPDGKLELANATFCKLMGLNANQLADQDFSTRIQQESAPGKTVFARLKANEQVHGTLALTRPGAEPLLIDGGFSAITDRSGKVQSYVMLATDVTARRTAERAVEQARSATEAAQKRVVDSLSSALNALSEGDLTVALNDRFADEYEGLRANFNQAIGKLLEALRSVVESATAINSEVAEISSASDDLSRRTEQQAATLEETAAALDELTSSVTSASEVAGKARTLVGEARDRAETSGQVVRQAVDAMGAIAESSDKISKITSVIDEIAFQTNLLALNAGVEAARAGEAGRGFAVVASEVRALAQRSSDAAREIADLISSSSAQIRRGVNLVGEAGQAIGSIENYVQQIFGSVNEIAASSTEQSAGLAEINIAVNQLDQNTQQNAAMFEETSAASQSLRGQAETLAEMVQHFRIGADNVSRAGSWSDRAA